MPSRPRGIGGWIKLHSAMADPKVVRFASLHRSGRGIWIISILIANGLAAALVVWILSGGVSPEADRRPASQISRETQNHADESLSWGGGIMQAWRRFSVHLDEILRAQRSVQTLQAQVQALETQQAAKVFADRAGQVQLQLPQAQAARLIQTGSPVGITGKDFPTSQHPLTHTDLLDEQDDRQSGKVNTERPVLLPVGVKDYTPAQLLTLALSYLQAHAYEKAATLLTHLLTEPAFEAYRQPRNYLLMGLAWYHLENFKLADTAFSEALRLSEDAPSVSALGAEAKLWRALVASRLRKNMQAQFWLSEIADQAPRSRSMTLINPTRAETSDDS